MANNNHKGVILNIHDEIVCNFYFHLVKIKISHFEQKQKKYTPKQKKWYFLQKKIINHTQIMFLSRYIPLKNVGKKQWRPLKILIFFYLFSLKCPDFNNVTYKTYIMANNNHNGVILNIHDDTLCYF